MMLNLFFSLLIFNLGYVISVSNSQIIHPKFLERLAILKEISKTAKFHGLGTCDYNRVVRITEIPYGRSGNNLIEFTHGLWIANKYNGTLEVPKWIQNIFHPFELTHLHNTFCFSEEIIQNPQHLIEITSEDSYMAWKLFQNPDYGGLDKLFPPSTNYIESVRELSMIFVQVYSSLWSSPHHHILAASSFIMKEFFHNNFTYTSVHKRSMEGGCNSIAVSCTNKDDYSPKDLPMNSAFWDGDLRQLHPICVMPAKFIVETQQLHNRNNEPIYLAFDGLGSIDDYNELSSKGQNVVLNSDIDKHEEHKHSNKVFLDMFMAINADFFVLNPFSTFSWEIYVIRTCLGLESVPIMKNNDFYMMKRPDSFEKLKRQGLWVGWLSIIEACEYLHHNKKIN